MADGGVGAYQNNAGAGAQSTTPGTTGAQTGTNKLNGWSGQQGYSGDWLQKTIYDNPWAILPDVFQGLNMNGNGYKSLSNLGADPLSLYNIMAGGTSSLASTTGSGAGDYTNWLANLYHDLGSASGPTGGSRAFSAGELLNQLFNPVGGLDKDGKEVGAQSALFKLLTAGNQTDQMRNLFNMAKDSSNVGMNPLAARGYQAALSNAGDAAIRMQRSGADSASNQLPIYQLIKQIAPSLVPG